MYGDLAYSSRRQRKQYKTMGRVIGAIIAAPIYIMFFITKQVSKIFGKLRG